MLKAGANVNIESEVDEDSGKQYTALTLAQEEGDRELVNILFQAGAQEPTTPTTLHDLQESLLILKKA